MFPLGRTGVEDQTTRSEMDEDLPIDSMLQTVMGQLRPRRAIPKENDDVPRPGSSYRRYRRESDLPEPAKHFYEAAAKAAGLSLPMLIRAVFHTELRLEHWQGNQRKLGHHGQIPETEPMSSPEVEDMEVDD